MISDGVVEVTDQPVFGHPDVAVLGGYGGEVSAQLVLARRNVIVLVGSGAESPQASPAKARIRSQNWYWLAVSMQQGGRQLEHKLRNEAVIVAVAKAMQS